MAFIQKQSCNILGKVISLFPWLMVSFSEFSFLHCVWPQRACSVRLSRNLRGVEVGLTSENHLVSLPSSRVTQSHLPRTMSRQFLACPRMENPSPPWENCASAWSASQWKHVSCCSKGFKGCLKCFLCSSVCPLPLGLRDKGKQWAS